MKLVKFLNILSTDKPQKKKLGDLKKKFCNIFQQPKHSRDRDMFVYFVFILIFVYVMLILKEFCMSIPVPESTNPNVYLSILENVYLPSWQMFICLYCNVICLNLVICLYNLLYIYVFLYFYYVIWHLGLWLFFYMPILTQIFKLFKCERKIIVGFTERGYVKC